MTNRNRTTAVFGGGITGLSAAYALGKRGIPVTLYEQSGSPGGAIRSLRTGSWLLEEGPNTLMVQSEAVWNLLKELGLDSRILEANQKASKRYILKNGKPVALPMSPGRFLTTGLISAKAKLRLLKEPFIPAAGTKGESIASFFSRRLGREPMEYMINPFVSGVYAGDPKQLSIAHTFSSLYRMEQTHGSLFKGYLKRAKSESNRKGLISFSNGIQALTDSLQSRLGNSVKLNHRVASLSRKDEGWIVGIDTPDGTKQNRFDAVISTLPAYALPHILEGNGFKRRVNMLANIDYAPMWVAHLGFRREQVNHELDGFGLLIPEAEQYQTLGVLFSSTLFPGRTPENHVLLTCFLGGARNPEAVRCTKKEIEEVLEKELGPLLGISGSPVLARHTRWEQAIPQYTLGYGSYLESMSALEQEGDGFFLAGSYRNGVSVPDCITNGFETAEKVYLLDQD